MRLTKNGINYTYDGDKLLREVHPGYALTYFYGIDGIIGYVPNEVASKLTLKQARGLDQALINID